MDPLLFTSDGHLHSVYNLLPVDAQQIMSGALICIGAFGGPEEVVELKSKKLLGIARETDREVTEFLEQMLSGQRPRRRSRHRHLHETSSVPMGPKAFKLKLNKFIAAELHKWTISPDLEPYQKSVLRVLLAWVCNSAFGKVGKRSLFAAIQLKLSAEHFPLLYQDAAVLMASHGQYKHAVKYMEEFLRVCSPLSEQTYEVALQRLQHYQERMADQEQLKVNAIDAERELDIERELDASFFGDQEKKSEKKESQTSLPPTTTEKDTSRSECSPSSLQARGILASSTATEVIAESDQLKDEPTVTVASPGIGTATSASSATINWLPDYDPTIRQFRKQLEMARCEDKNGIFNSEGDCLNHWLKSSKAPGVRARVCEEACWYYLYLYQSQVSRTPEDYLEEDQIGDVSKQQDAIKLASQWLAKAESLTMGFESRYNLPCPDFMRHTQPLLKNPPDVSDFEEYKKRLRALSSTRGHINSSLVEHFSYGKSKKYGNAAQHVYTSPMLTVYSHVPQR